MGSVFRRGYYIRLLISFLALATLTLLLSSIIIYKNYKTETVKENSIISEQMLSQTVYGADLIWDWASMHAIELYNNKSLFHTIYGKDITMLDEFNAQTIMSYAMASNPFIYSIYLYNGNINRVFSTVGVSYSTKEFFDQNILKILKNKPLYSEYRFTPRTIDFKLYNTNYKKDVISLIFPPPATTGNTPIEGAIVLNVDILSIQNLINSLNIVKDDYFIILDQSGKVISHSEAGMFQKDLSQEKYVKQCQNSEKVSDYFTQYVNGKKYLITYVKSDKLKWSFIRLNEFNKAFKKTFGLRNIIIILTGILLILIIVISLLLSWRFYTPIGGLVNLVNKNMINVGKDTKRRKVNEFELISETYSKVVENSNYLKKQQTDNRAFLRREFLKNMLNGEVQHYSDIGEKFRELDIKLDLSIFMLVMIRIDNYWSDFITDKNENDIELLKFAISNIAEEIIDAKYNCIAFGMRNEGIAVVINPKNETKDILRESVSSCISEIQKAVKEYLDINISGTIGTSAKNISDLPLLYKNIVDISNYRLIFGKGSIIFPEMVEENMNSEYVYQDEIEKEIMENLKLHNYKGVEARTNKFFENLKTMSYDDIMISIFRLSYVSFKWINSILPKNNLEYNYKALQKRFEYLDTLEEIRLWLLNMYKVSIESVTVPVENAKYKHVEKILEIIDKDYFNSNLSSDELAEYLGLSSNYLREIFKEIKGIPLANYINEFRCEKAKAMLLNTNMTVGEISEKIGLVNQNYFFTLFKKYSGFTPAQFRNQNK
jgi:two-component system, response regulator YesN